MDAGNVVVVGDMEFAQMAVGIIILLFLPCRRGISNSRGKKKDCLIYSSPGLGAATVSGNSAVSHDDKAGAANRGGSPTSDKSGDLGISTIPPEEAESKENSL